jgi:anti-sigma factor ChrR (cupin superfamily)
MRATKHPSEETLALHAGGDLGPIARWRAERHLRQCELCQEEVAAFQGVRRMVSELSAVPEVPWNRMAAEMQANIRLGLAAGECVRQDQSPNEGLARFGGFRAAVALASVTVVVAAGLMLQKPAPRMPAGQMMLQATADGIQVSKGGEALGMMHDSAIKNVSYSANTQGSIGESYVDPVTGDVTMTRVGW